MSIINFQEKKGKKQEELSKVVHLSHFVKLRQVARFERIKLVNGLILKIHKLRLVAENIVRESSLASKGVDYIENCLEEILCLASEAVDTLCASENESSIELLNIYGQYRQDLDKKVKVFTEN